MPTVELDIRQLADEGGTAPIAPITVTDAVLDENGDTLTDTISEIKSGLEKVHIVDTAINVTVDNNHRAFITRPTNKHFLIGISSSDANPKIVAGQNWDGNFIVYCPANAGGYTYTASAFWVVDD